jgi:choline dehydrogenase
VATPTAPATEQPASTAEFEAEFVVVGSGAGGAPLACRLARAGHSVILLEAGGDDTNPNVEVPAFHLFASEDPAIDWAFYVEHYADEERQRRDSKYQEGRGILYPRAATVGGCTTHNALVTIYPHDHDWNQIADLVGDDSWNAKAMRRWFRQLEHCDYLDDPEGTSLPSRILAPPRALLRSIGKLLGLRGRLSGHGFKGWLHTQRAAPELLLLSGDWELLKQVGRSVLASLTKEGKGTWRRLLSGTFDPNDARLADDSEGFARVPLSTNAGRRNGPRELIRDTLAEAPGKLNVITHALAARVVLDQDGAGEPRASGVEFLQGERLYRAHQNPSTDAGTPLFVRATREVVLAAGAFNTPQLLKLSGIGDPEELSRHGIEPVVPLAGVGRNLQDRYEIGVVHKATKDFVLTKDLHFRAPVPGETPEKAWRDWEAGGGVYSLNGVVGAVIRRSSDKLPVSDLFIFGFPSQFRGYYPGYSTDSYASRDRFTWAILKAHTHNQGGEVLLRSADPRDTPRICFHYFDEGTDTEGKDLDAVVEGVRFARELMAGWGLPDGELVPGPEHADDARLREFIRDEAWGHHASCTCPMGADGDPSAVLDGRLRVRGVSGLRVVDASAFPRIPGFFIVSAVYMLSEKAAALILADHGTPVSRAGRFASRVKAALPWG